MAGVAVVTGSARGLGSALAAELAKSGYSVVVNYRKSRRDALETLQAVRRWQRDSAAIRADVSDEKAVNRLFSAVLSSYGKVDVLVNNVGDFIYKPLASTTPREFSDVLESNLMTAVLCTAEVLPSMRKARFGRIINMGCAGCDRMVTPPRTTPYYIAKTGLLMLTRSLASSEIRFGITVNMVSPGVLETSVAKLQRMPGGRHVRFSDVAGAVNFLVGPGSGYVTGANIEVSGGWQPGLDIGGASKKS